MKPWSQGQRVKIVFERALSAVFLDLNLSETKMPKQGVEKINLFLAFADQQLGSGDWLWRSGLAGSRGMAAELNILQRTSRFMSMEVSIAVRSYVSALIRSPRHSSRCRARS
jgi:hypothetical protein